MKLTPVFPPKEASTIERSVVGTFIKSIPLFIVDAAKPPISVTTPPPKFNSKLFLSQPFIDRKSHIFLQVSRFLKPSPVSIKILNIFFSLLIFFLKTSKHLKLVFPSTKMKILE